MRVGIITGSGSYNWPFLDDARPRVVTWFDTPGQPGRGHWVLDAGPFSEALRRTVLAAARATHDQVVDGGTYGHVDGPRFNTRAEVRALATAGVTAVSQTAGPEAVLAGEAELPMALVGYVTDYANGIAQTPEPVSALVERMAASTGVFATLAAHTLHTLSHLDAVPPAGFVHRFDA